MCPPGGRPRPPASRRVPPAHVLRRVDGRVLDPSTALSVKGVHPRSTVYVGPRLLVSRGPQDEAAIATLEQTAERLGWSLTVSRASTSTVRDQKGRVIEAGPVWEPVDPARTRAGTSRTSGHAEGEVVRLDLTVADNRATVAPDGWVLLQNARAEAKRLRRAPARRARPRRAGAQHRARTRTRSAPLRGDASLRGAPLGGGLHLRGRAAAAAGSR